MKTLILIISIFTIANLCAEPKEQAGGAPAESAAELKREIAELEKRLLKLKIRLAEMERDLAISIPVEQRKGDLVINVLPDGRVLIDKVEFSKDLLEKRLRRASMMSKDVEVFIRGGSKVKKQTVVEIVDLCRKVGIYNIGLAIQKQKK